MRLTKTIGIVICMLGTLLPLQAAKHAAREEINFNREWKYLRGNPDNAEKPGLSDQHWERIGLPHSFSIPYFMSKDFYIGYGWYRKSFTLDKEDLNKKLFLEFDGVFQEAEVFVNGTKVGSHVGGYTGFSVDISPAVSTGSNQVAVRVNNIWKSNVAPRAGEHTFSGGIYRNVRLVKKSPLHIAWYGTFVTTPDLGSTSGRSSTVQVSTEICNQSASTADYKLVTEVRDAKGKVVATAISQERIEAGASKTCKQTTKPIRNPRLWNPQSPHLYKLVSTLYLDKEVADRTETTFGFRWFEWTADRGFFLNGKHLYFHGANVHQDHAGWGDAMTEAAMRRDVSQMKEAGFDLIRGSHYPHSPAFSQACDEQGMLFWSEATFWGIGGFKPDGYWDSSAYPVNPEDEAAFEASALKQLEEMIRIHRNHPSITAWSMSNEAFFSAAETMPGVRRLLKRMVDLSHQLDPTRPAAVGGAQRPLGKGRIDLIGDIAGYNGDGATIPDFQNPGKPNVVAEYGSTTSDRPGEYTPGWGDLQANDGWKGRPWRSGQVIWCGFDHGSIAGATLGKMGIVDYFRIPKRAWYWYRNEYAQTPPPAWPTEGTPTQIKLQTSQATNILADGTDDAQLTIHILDAAGRLLSNSPSVLLEVISGPGEFPTGRSILFESGKDIRIMDGQAAIAFRSYHAGTTIIEATSPGLKPARIELSFTGAPAYQSGVTSDAYRPYTPFTRKKLQAPVVQTFGRNNPTFASSQHTGQSAGLAADGDNNTCWQAAAGDASPWWMLDTEKGLALRHINVRFPQSHRYRYIVEVSIDNKEWTMVMDKQNASNSEQEADIKLKADEKPILARYIRIRFVKDSPATIAEMKVSGVVQ